MAVRVVAAVVPAFGLGLDKGSLLIGFWTGHSHWLTGDQVLWAFDIQVYLTRKVSRLAGGHVTQSPGSISICVLFLFAV